MQTAVSQKGTTLTRELVVQNRSGIHARVSTMIAQRCKAFASEIRLRKGNVVADCRSVLDLLSLGACNGVTVSLEVSGDDAEEVVNVFVAMFEARFNEDEESSTPPTSSAST
jgi:phosphotransferase system HPr (HPr) family protein